MIHSQKILEELVGNNGTVESDVYLDERLGNIWMDIPIITEEEIFILYKACEGASEMSITKRENGMVKVWLVFYDLFEYRN